MKRGQIKNLQPAAFGFMLCSPSIKERRLDMATKLANGTDQLLNDLASCAYAYDARTGKKIGAGFDKVRAAEIISKLISQAPDAKDAKAFAEELSDAYSTSTYGDNWLPCIKMMRRKYAFNDRAIESIIRSKWTRWAADERKNYKGVANSADLARFLDAQPNLVAEVKELVDMTFGKDGE